MAVIRVDDGGSNTSPYDTWAKAAVAIQTALDAWASGDVIYVHVGSTGPHAESFGGATTFSSSAADAAEDPILIYGVDKDNSDASVDKPSTVILDVTSSNLAITANSIWHGMNIRAEDDININASNTLVSFYQSIITPGPGSGDDLQVGAQSCDVLCDGCTIVADQINPKGAVHFRNCSLESRATPNFSPAGSGATVVVVDGCDLSANTSGDTIVNAAVNEMREVTFINCDMPATWSGVTGTFQEYGNVVRFFNCDDASDYPRTEIYSKAGDVKMDTGVYITTGAWSDETANSTGTPLSQKMTPSSELHSGYALESLPIDAYLDSTGSKTFTVELIDDFQTTLQDDEVWLEIFYHATSGQVKQSVGTSRVLPVDTVANLSAGTGTGNWTGEPASSRSVKLAVTVTTGNIGWYSAVVRLAKYEANGADTNPGAALYVAPLLTIS